MEFELPPPPSLETVRKNLRYHEINRAFKDASKELRPWWWMHPWDRRPKWLCEMHDFLDSLAPESFTDEELAPVIQRFIEGRD